MVRGKRQAIDSAFIKANASLDSLEEKLVLSEVEAEAIADAETYSSGESLSYAESQNIDAWIPNFVQYKPVREGFTYNKEQDQYECQRGNRAILPFRKIVTDSKGYDKRVYRSTNAKSKTCPLRSGCIGRSDYKKIEESIHKPYYDRMHQKMQTAYARKIMRIPSRTVKPVLGILLNFMNMKRVNTRGIVQADKQIRLYFESLGTMFSPIPRLFPGTFK
jgi:hypothetical protein